MNKLIPYRPFIFRTRTDIDEYIDKSPEWNSLYRLYLSMRRNVSSSMNALATFNAVYLACVCALLDKHPEDNVDENYFDPVRAMNGVDVTVCYSLVYVLLRLMKRCPPRLDLFLGELHYMLQTDRYRSGHDYLNPIFNEAVEYVKALLPENETGIWDINLLPESENPWCLPTDEAWWKLVTDDFNEYSIRFALEFWTSNQEKLLVLKQIEKAGAASEKCAILRTELKAAKVEGESSILLNDSFSYFSGIIDLYNACQSLYQQLTDPRVELAVIDSRSAEQIGYPFVHEKAIEAFLDGVKNSTESVRKVNLLLAEILQAKAALEADLAQCAAEVKRQLDENRQLADEKIHLQVENRNLKDQIAQLRGKDENNQGQVIASQVEKAGKEVIDTLVDKAIEMGDEKHLHELTLWLHELNRPRLTRAAIACIKKRLIELKQLHYAAQHVYHGGAKHVENCNIIDPEVASTLLGKQLPPSLFNIQENTEKHENAE